MVEEKVYGYERRMYISGISGDNIAYVTQASDSVTVTSQNVSIQGTIFRHTDEVLYVDLNPLALSRLLNLTSKECSWQVNVTFSLKDSYFASLQRFVRSLAPDIINRLLPSDFPPFTPASLMESYEALNLQICSDDQRNALATIVACPIGSPPVLVTGPFGTGKTRILALAAHYFLQCSTSEQSKTCILVCTQQHVSADAFLDCLMNLMISIPDTAYVVRLTNRSKSKHQYKQGTAGSVFLRHLRSYDELESDFQHKPPTNKRPYLIVTTCQTAHSLKNRLPGNFFSHILLDEVAQMREAEAVAPLCLANTTTKIILAGDKMQVCT